MTFLIDENFPRSAADVLTAAGHEVLFVDDVCEFGADDEELFVAAQERHAVPPANFQRNGRCTINADKCFLVNRS